MNAYTVAFSQRLSRMCVLFTVLILEGFLMLEYVGGDLVKRDSVSKGHFKATKFAFFSSSRHYLSVSG